jgi:hypothetical protein
MPVITPSKDALKEWGALWLGTDGSNGRAKKANCFDRKQSLDFGKVFDQAFGEALAVSSPQVVHPCEGRETVKVACGLDRSNPSSQRGRSASRACDDG